MKRKLLIILLISILCLIFFKDENVEAEEEIIEDPNIIDLLNKYYNGGVYKKDSKIYLNEDGVNDLKRYFHVETKLERITYYLYDSLWMSQDIDDGSLYSYYGTKYQDGVAVGVTYGITYDYLTPPKTTDVVLSGENKNSMEEYYTTLKDIKEADVSWQYNNNIFETTDKVMLKYFLDFTAPCLYESIIDTHTFDYDKATIEVNNEGNLVLKLWVSSLDYGYIEGKEQAVIDGSVVLSSAEIINPEIKGVEALYYPSLSNADVVEFNGNIYTYGGSPDGSNRTNSIYCYNIESNTVYELDAKLETISTSHRIYLHGGKVYIFGGLTKGARILSIQVHDLVNQKVEVLEKQMPFGMNCEQLGYYNGKLYFAGGSTSLGNSNKIYEMDLYTLEMVELVTQLPTIVFKGAWCTVDKYLYIIGGTNGNRLTSIIRFNMETKEVMTMNAKLPIETSQSRAAYDGMGNIYIYGGTLNDGSLTDTIYKYNIESDMLETVSYKLPYSIANTCVVRVNDLIYILGGNNDINNIILAHDGVKITKLLS